MSEDRADKVTYLGRPSEMKAFVIDKNVLIHVLKKYVYSMDISKGELKKARSVLDTIIALQEIPSGDNDIHLCHSSFFTEKSE